MISGVCNGLAAYFGIDVTLVRVVFVLFAVLTGGIGVAVYLVMMIVVPVAVTAEQMAAAHGKPFNAEELIGRPQGPQASFAPAALGQQWREQRRMWRDQRRQWRRSNVPGMVRGCTAAPPPYGWHGAPYPAITDRRRWVLVRERAGTGTDVDRIPVRAGGAAVGRPILGWDWAALVPIGGHYCGVRDLWNAGEQMRMAHYYGMLALTVRARVVALVGSVVWLLILVSVGWYLVHHWPRSRISCSGHCRKSRPRSTADPGIRSRLRAPPL